MNDAHASSKVKLLDAMNITINLLRMERAPKISMSVPSLRLATDEPRHCDDFRADLNTGREGGFQVDRKPHLVALDDECDHASRLRKCVAFTDAQDTGALQLIEDLRSAFRFRRTYE